MKNIIPTIIFLSCLFSIACTRGQKNDKGDKKSKSLELSSRTGEVSTMFQLPKKLKEISGIVKDGEFLWAVSDNPKSDIYKLDMEGNVVQQLELEDIKVSDVEDIAADNEYLYVADVGDNNGTQEDRQIIKIKKSEIGNGEKESVKGEVIRFSFPSQDIDKKKENQNDCESIISYKESLYLFTKRRNDKQSQLFILSKTPGKQVPKAIGLFDTKGLVTGAAVNDSGNEVALVGYQDGHKHPFIWLFSAFSGDNFFSGRQEYYELPGDIKDWQVEGIAYKDADSFIISSEETPDVDAELYAIPKSGLVKK